MSFSRKLSTQEEIKKNSLGSHTQEHMASPQQQAPNNKNSKWKQKLVDLTLEDDSEESSDHGTSKCNHFCKKLLNSKKKQELFPFPPKKNYTMEWDKNQKLQPESTSKLKFPYPFRPQFTTSLWAPMESSKLFTGTSPGTPHSTTQLRS